MTREKSRPTSLNRSLRLTLRLLWIGATLILLTFFIGGIPYRFLELNRACVASPCPLMALTWQEADALINLGLSLDAYAAWQIGLEVLLGGVMTLLALLLFTRSFEDAQGILVTFMLVLLGLNFLLEADTSFVDYNPLFQPLYDVLTALTGVALTLFLFIFPDGRFVPSWTRIPLALFAAVSLVEPFIRPGNATPSAQFSYIYLFSFLACGLIGLGAQVFRYRYVSTPIQRQQTKWVTVGLGAIIGPIFLYATFVEIFPLEAGAPRLFFNTVGFGAMAISILFFPISMVISILRYRLWDVDIIIRRTLVYAALTALLAVVYFSAVILLQSLFNSLTGQDSALAVVLSTLAIAALFAPLRLRVQAFFDRRFYRSKYDAALALDRFARTARDEVDLDSLTQELSSVVDDTMQPEHFSLWLRNISR